MAISGREREREGEREGHRERERGTERERERDRERERQKTMAGYYNLGARFESLIGRPKGEVNFVFCQILKVSS